MNSESQSHKYFFTGLNFKKTRQYIQYFIQYYFIINTVLFGIKFVFCNTFTEYHDIDALINCLTIPYNAVFYYLDLGFQRRYEQSSSDTYTHDAAIFSSKS
mgnify:CR=1 FL=1